MKKKGIDVVEALYNLYEQQKGEEVLSVPADLFDDFLKVLNRTLKSKLPATELRFCGKKLVKVGSPPKLKSVGFTRNQKKGA